MAHSTLNFIIKSVNAEQRTVAGLLTAEVADKDNEVFDYPNSKPYFLKWSQEAQDATRHLGEDKVSYGNVREQHSKKCVGKFISIVYDDDRKTIYGVAKIVDDDAWQNCKDGVYTAFSVGGSLVQVRREGRTKFITINPREVSIVDNPALGVTHFDYVKDASCTIQKAFKSQPITTAEEAIYTIEKVLAQLKESDVEKAVRHLVTESDGTQHLPVTNEDGSPNHNLMGAAWAALHGGYRGNKYEGPDKGEALAKLKRMYESEGMDLPSQKEASADTEKQLSNPSLGDKQMATTIEKAAMKSLHDHLHAMKAAHTAHKEAMHKLASDHEAEMHAHADKVLEKLGGAMNGQECDAEAAAKSGDVQKALEAIKSLTEQVTALTAAATEKAATEKAAADKLAVEKAAADKLAADKAEADRVAKAAQTEKVVGDRDNTKENDSESAVEKAARVKKESDYNADLAQRGFGGVNKPADQKALLELYDRTVTVTRKAVPASLMA